MNNIELSNQLFHFALVYISSGAEMSLRRWLALCWKVLEEDKLFGLLWWVVVVGKLVGSI